MLRSMARCTSLSEPYDHGLSAQLITFIITGMAFMLLPGTFLGVVNLFKISASATPSAADTAWIQAHGHAQIFGWLGTFILGVGFYAIPRLRLSRYSAAAAWTTYGLWVAGVTMRWAGGVTPWHWRELFRTGNVLELLAVTLFFVSVFVPAPRAIEEKWRSSVLMIEVAALGMAAALVMNVYEAFRIATPVFPNAFNQRFLGVATWGFVVPFIWGFATRWVPPLMGLPKSRKSFLLPVVALLFAGIAVNAPAVILAACVGFVLALRIFEPSQKEPKLRGVHPSIAFFLRSAFGWMIIAAVLAIVASLSKTPNGFTGAGRHALTVGFMVVTVFCIGPRVLPAFFGKRRLFSTNMMFASLLLVSAGCAMRVGSQVLAYGHISSGAWRWLPASAVLEMTAVMIFAVNMLLTLTTGSPLETFYEAQNARDAIRNQNEAPRSI